MISGRASGISTWVRICHSVIPLARAASMVCRSTDSRPGVRPGQHGRDGQDHEGDGRSDDRRPVVGQHVAEHHQQEEQHAQGRQRAHRPGEGDHELPPLAGVPDVEAERQGDQSGDDDGDRRCRSGARPAGPGSAAGSGCRGPSSPDRRSRPTHSAGGSSGSSRSRHLERGGRHAARSTPTGAGTPRWSRSTASTPPIPTITRSKTQREQQTDQDPHDDLFQDPALLAVLEQVTEVRLAR